MAAQNVEAKRLDRLHEESGSLLLEIEKELKAAHALAKLNRVLHASTLSSRFASLLYGELEENGSFFYYNAGHDAPLLVTDAGCAVLRTGGTVLGPLPDAQRFERLGPALSTHSMFPQGTNVEFAQVEARDRVRIMIWERGVGPTSSSGTGSSASAVAAAAHGGAARAVDVIAPGGTQRVEWQDDGVYLTGWAEVVFDGQWLGGTGSI